MRPLHAGNDLSLREEWRLIEPYQDMSCARPLSSKSEIQCCHSCQEDSVAHKNRASKIVAARPAIAAAVLDSSQAVTIARSALERPPNAVRNSLKIREVEHVLVGKVGQFFRNMLDLT